jgi:t-SNARE complex subunit (syntaxin)
VPDAAVACALPNITHAIANTAVVLLLLLCTANTVLAEVQDTYEDVRRLEASILELHRMFMDLALLVEQQGETLDVIEFQVATLTRAYTHVYLLQQYSIEQPLRSCACSVKSVCAVHITLQLVLVWCTCVA